MTESKPRLKPPKDLKQPPPLTPEELERICDEAGRARAQMNARLAGMEVLTAEDLRIRLQ